MNKKRNILTFMVFGLVGGFLGGWATQFFETKPSYADSIPQVVRANEFQLIDPKTGNYTARLTTNLEGSPSLFFFDAKGNVRLSIGLYGDGQPSVVLNTLGNQAKAILRLAGKDAPVLVMKNNGQDRIILGLDLATAKDPFLVTFDEKGQKKEIFGKY